MVLFFLSSIFLVVSYFGIFVVVVERGRLGNCVAIWRKKKWRVYDIIVIIIFFHCFSFSSPSSEDSSCSEPSSVPAWTEPARPLLVNRVGSPTRPRLFFIFSWWNLMIIWHKVFFSRLFFSSSLYVHQIKQNCNSKTNIEIDIRTKTNISSIFWGENFNFTKFFFL